MDSSEKQKNQQEKAESSIGSILFSVLLVALAMGFVFGFKYFLAGKNYSGPADQGIDEDLEEKGQPDQVTMKTDKSFKYKYIMIQGLDGRDLRAFKDPVSSTATSASEETTADSSKDINSIDKDNHSTGMKFTEGQILAVKKRGYIDGKLYYLLDNGLYLKDGKSILPLKENVTLTGYVTITYISASGVRLRKWADFDADNIAGSVYVGDKVNIRGKVTTVTDTSAFITSEGYYITTDNRYLNDHTNVVEKNTPSPTEESTTLSDESASTEQN